MKLLLLALLLVGCAEHTTNITYEVTCYSGDFITYQSKTKKRPGHTSCGVIYIDNDDSSETTVTGDCVVNQTR